MWAWPEKVYFKCLSIKFGKGLGVILGCVGVTNTLCFANVQNYTYPDKIKSDVIKKFNSENSTVPVEWIDKTRHLLSSYWKYNFLVTQLAKRR